MDFAAFRQHARTQFEELAAELGEAPGALQVHEALAPHPVVADALLLASHAAGGARGAPYTVHLHHGSFLAILERDADLDPRPWIAERLETEIDEALATIEAAEQLDGEAALFAAHAAFRAGGESPFAFWREGDPLGPACWSVDLDVFVELDLLRSEWDALRGHRSRLTIAGETLEIEIPVDADPDEVLTLPGAGLMEEDPAATVDADEEEEGQDANLLTAGALHLIPIIR